MKKNAKAAEVCWDHSEGFNLKNLEEALKYVGFKGSIKEVNTESDLYSFYISDDPSMTKKDAQKIFDDETKSQLE